ncbi:MAG: chorismate synthase [Candidatus Hydrogenedentota bacterium]|nr:MAG: chorismate synthase [Candidatus Hydrogenedentota bacterium]
MSGNTFGRLFRVTSCGESHGAGIGVILDGVPPGLSLDPSEIDAALARRRPGQSDLVSPRSEADRCEIFSGVESGVTLGTPIGVLVRNKDARPESYDEIKNVYRPSHADFTYERKYGRTAASGGGRASARETIARVVGGVVAEKILSRAGRIEIVAAVERVGTIETKISPDDPRLTRESVDAHPVRCPVAEIADKMGDLIRDTRRQGDSLGGIILAVARNVPAGWGDPVFDKIDATLAHALFSLPAVKGVEIGSGFGGVALRGSEHNDVFENREGRIQTRTNRSGGIQGGITNGENIVVRIAFKPTSTIALEQDTVTRQGEPARLKGRGRHDPCVLPRAVPIVEAMIAIVLADHYLRQRAITF